MRAIDGICSCAVHLANGRVCALTPADRVYNIASPSILRRASNADVQNRIFFSYFPFRLLLSNSIFLFSNTNDVH